MKRFITHLRNKTIDIRKYSNQSVVHLTTFFVEKQQNEEPFIQYINNIINQGSTTFHFTSLVRLYTLLTEKGFINRDNYTPF